MLPKAIIFDLDDTIISLKGTANETWQLMCDEYSKINNNVDSKTLYTTITETRLAYWNDRKSNDKGRKNQKEARREIIGNVFDKLNLPREDVNLIADTFSEKRLKALRFFPMAQETLEILKKKGIKLALITNGEAKIQRYKIERFELEKYFDIILIETEVGYGKPDIRTYKSVMDYMNVMPNQTWSIGDNLIWDVQAPQKLGIYSIWNDFENVGLPEDTTIVPDRIITRIHDII
ncbi:HAD family hydrolase [Abyssisolibacter fermentans]|uniref:HAD family hydrolase n=1 Tax=Abyssisolibacter fermentans TaxID=1766203 RepID=UPI00082A6136|nr:HAD family hydrolase [Abyssisolibacter fermentans]